MSKWGICWRLFWINTHLFRVFKAAGWLSVRLTQNKLVSMSIILKEHVTQYKNGALQHREINYIYKALAAQTIPVGNINYFLVLGIFIGVVDNYKMQNIARSIL